MVQSVPTVVYTKIQERFYKISKTANTTSTKGTANVQWEWWVILGRLLRLEHNTGRNIPAANHQTNMRITGYERRSEFISGI